MKKFFWLLKEVNCQKVNEFIFIYKKKYNEASSICNWGIVKWTYMKVFLYENR